MDFLNNHKYAVYLAAGLAFFSMFLPWAVFGIRKDSGWDLEFFFVLAFWVIPVLSVEKLALRTMAKISIIIAALGLIIFVGPMDEIEIFGNSYSAKVGAGAYVYLLAWLLGCYAVFFTSRDVSELSSSTNDVDQDKDLYPLAYKEFENNEIDQALWVKCITINNGDEKLAKYEYIKQRVKKMALDSCGNSCAYNESIQKKLPGISSRSMKRAIIIYINIRNFIINYKLQITIILFISVFLFLQHQFPF